MNTKMGIKKSESSNTYTDMRLSLGLRPKDKHST